MATISKNAYKKVNGVAEPNCYLTGLLYLRDTRLYSFVKFEKLIFVIICIVK